MPSVKAGMPLDETLVEPAEQLHADAIVVDGLLPMTYIEEPDYNTNLQSGGVSAGNFTVASRTNFAQATTQVQSCKRQVANVDGFVLAETVDDIRTAHESAHVAVIMGFQDTMPIAPESRMKLGEDTEYIDAFRDMGVRIIQLTYNSLNYVGAGCCERVDPGLSDFGHQAVAAMNEAGIVVDLSHCGDQTTTDAIDHSTDPVVLSHVGLRALSNIGRNKTDEHVKAVAENGGVVGVTFFPPCVKSHPETHEVQEATVHDVVDQIDRVVELAGIDHVGFGTDMNDMYLDTGTTPPHAAYRNFRPAYADVYGQGPIEEYEPFPKGIERHTNLMTLTHALFERSYSETEIRKILGENFLRVFETVWQN